MRNETSMPERWKMKNFPKKIPLFARACECSREKSVRGGSTQKI